MTIITFAKLLGGGLVVIFIAGIGVVFGALVLGLARNFSVKQQNKKNIAGVLSCACGACIYKKNLVASLIVCLRRLHI